MQDWVEINVRVTPDAEEAISNMLWESGSNGVIQRDGDTTGITETVVGFLPKNTDLESKIGGIRNLWNDLCRLDLATGDCHIEIRPVPTSDWTTSWQKLFAPVQISDRLIIAPPWVKFEATDTRRARIVLIEPGMAFGTGEHETTQLCLRMLEKEVRSGDRVLDIGAGSGILSITSVFSGAQTATAIDIDEEAIENARDNIRRNGVSEQVQVHAGQIDHPAVNGPYRVIVSNTDLKTLISLLPSFTALLASDGVLLLSGVLLDEEDALTARLDAHGFLLRERYTMGEWWGGVAGRAI